MIDALIDKQDNSELIGRKIADILKAESANQMALATAAGKDPDQWKLRVFYERAHPWEEFLNEDSDKSPIVNVFQDDTNYLMNESDIVANTKAMTVWNVDIYGYGVSSQDGSGQIRSDQASALCRNRGLRLARNILMSAEYTYLSMRGIVEQRWPNAVSLFQPQYDNQQMQSIWSARLSFQVKYVETSPQIIPVTIESLFTTFVDADNAEVQLLEIEYDLT